MRDAWLDHGDVRIWHGDVIECLRGLDDGIAQTCVTSPPYWGLRDYGTATWSGGDDTCDHVADATKTKEFGNPEFNKGRASREATKVEGYYYKSECGKCGARRIDSQIGLEQTPDEYVARMVGVFREVRRVLRDDGTLWLNLGDSYAAARGGTYQPAETLAGGVSGKTHDGELTNRGRGTGYQASRDAASYGLKHKDLVGIPWRVAFALQTDGWYLRSDIIWAKPNPMPESVTDRPTKSHEYVFLLSKSARYFYDAEAIKESSITNDARRPYGSDGAWQMDGRNKFNEGAGELRETDATRRNARSVWQIATKPYAEAHFATFPIELPERCIKAGSAAGDTVLDPFMGSGTTAWVARHLGRHAIGTELNEEYLRIAAKRLQQLSLLGEEGATSGVTTTAPAAGRDT